jgi:citrate synthase
MVKQVEQQRREDAKVKLLRAVLEAHRKSALRDNASSVVIREVFAMHRDFAKAVAAGLMTLGGIHAPLENTAFYLRHTLDGVKAAVQAKINRDSLMPGWGNSFIKGRRDELWIEVDDLLHAHFPELAEKLDAVTGLLQAAGKNVFPNPSAYTVCAALAFDLASHQAVCLFIRGRMLGWEEICFGPAGGRHGSTLKTEAAT